MIAPNRHQRHRDGSSEACWALGMMSGTSLDGVDAAYLLTDGHKIHEFGPVDYQAYDEQSRADIYKALGEWQETDVVNTAAKLVEKHHIMLAEQMLAQKDAALVGFHGQTVAHDPENRRSHQIGKGQVLADQLNRPVIWDFRSSDLAMGGQGAPLAPFFHHACARYLGYKEPVVFLNLGGVGNLTWVNPTIEMPEQDGAILAFDTGPANAPLDDLMRERHGLSHDQGGALAETGVVDFHVVERFLKHPFFAKMPPKSLDRNSFHQVLDLVSDLNDKDGLRSIIACICASISQALSFCPIPPKQIFVCGGGRRNKTLMDALRHDLAIQVNDVNDVGLDGDMLEAQAFAYLAVRVLRGLPTSGPSTTGVGMPVAGGILSKPMTA